MKRSAIAGAGIALLPRIGWAFSQSPTIYKYVTPLRGLGPTQIPVLTPNTTAFPGTDYYQIAARQFTQTIYSYGGVTLSPRFWGYADATGISYNSKYLGGLIVAKRARPVKLKVWNNLPTSPIIPTDLTQLDSQDSGRVDRMAIHLHGGLVRWDMDGGPYLWFSNAKNPGGFIHGSSFVNGPVPTTALPNPPGLGSATYDYPNDQSARLLWYHDHAHGTTRTNAYAGLATGYIIWDDAEMGLINSGVLPSTLGGLYTYGIPLIIQDKAFWDPAKDPNYPISGKKAGDLWYPYQYEYPTLANPLPSMTPPFCGTGTARWDTNNPGAMPAVSCVAEAFGDTMLVNGAPYPTITLPPARFRFRILNPSQARFLNLQMYVKDTSADGITLAPVPGEYDNNYTLDSTGTAITANGNPLLAPTNLPGPAFIQIGTEGGFLPAPVVFTKDGTNKNSNNRIGYNLDITSPRFGLVNRYNLLLAPAERADIIVDFRDFAGQKIILYTDAPAPFPAGDIRNDYYPGAPDLTCIGGAAPSKAGAGPDTRIIMQFDIKGTPPTDPFTFADTINALNNTTSGLPAVFAATQPVPFDPNTLPAPLPKSLNEDFDTAGRLRQRIGTVPGGMDLIEAPTEIATPNEVQVWQIKNLTGDTHPLHFHLVNVQIIKREAYDPVADAIIPNTAVGPDPNEVGWKETVRMNPNEAITVAMKFENMPPGASFSPRLWNSFGIKGAEYVWHCHILEHEEHDMMRPMVVTM